MRILNRVKISIGIVIAAIYFAAIPAFADNVDVRLIMMGCNEDLICNPSTGENHSSCPTDCSSGFPEPNYGNPIESEVALPHSEVTVTPSFDNSVIEWSTTDGSRATVSWGLSSDYEQGSLSETDYTKNHVVKLSNLEPGTLYYFKIRMWNIKGNNTTYISTFTTQSLTEVSLPPNVASLGTFKADNGIGLFWINPQYELFDYVRVVRSTIEYPLEPQDGRVIYEGGAQTFVDTDVKEGITYYYAVFVRNTNGIYSSGALVAQKRITVVLENPLDSVNGVPIPEQPRTPRPIENPRDTNSTSTSSVVGPKVPLHKISFVQSDVDLSFASNIIPVDGNKSLYVSVPQALIDEKEIFIAINIGYGDNPIRLFLMRYNPVTGNLEAEIPAFMQSGNYNFSIQSLDNAQFNHLSSGVFAVEYTPEAGLNDQRGSWSKMLAVLFTYIVPIFITFFVIFFGWFWIFRKR
jgi:hypothetical protein